MSGNDFTVINRSSIDRLSIPGLLLRLKNDYAFRGRGWGFSLLFSLLTQFALIFSLFGMFCFHANKVKKHTFFRLKARTKIPTFSLIYALSEYERRTLARSVFLLYFVCSKLIRWTYPENVCCKSLTDVWIWKLGTRPRTVWFLGIHNSNILCSAITNKFSVVPGNGWVVTLVAFSTYA